MIERAGRAGWSRHRLVAAAAFGLLAVGVLAGCRSEPGTAAFVGDTRISDAQVEAQMDSLVADIKTAQAQQATQSGQAPQPFDRTEALTSFCGGEAACRQTILETLVLRDVAKQYLLDHRSDPQFSTGGDPLGDAQKAVEKDAATSHIQRSDLYQWTGVEATAYIKQLSANLTPVTATDADYRAIYQRLKEDGAINGSYDQVKGAIAQVQGLGQGLAATKLLAGAVRTYDVDVNPRYLPTPVAGQPNRGFDIPTFQVPGSQNQPVTLLAVTLDSNDSAVITTPSAAPGGGQPGPAAP